MRYQLTLLVSASTHFPVDERLIPLGEHPVSGDLDLRAGRGLAGLRLNHCYGTISPADDRSGRCLHQLDATDGRRLEVWTDPDFGFVQVYTCSDFPRTGCGGETVAVTAVAVEPMTAPPDALNSGIGVRWLAPHESWSSSWDIELTTVPRGRARHHGGDVPAL